MRYFILFFMCTSVFSVFVRDVVDFSKGNIVGYQGYMSTAGGWITGVLSTPNAYDQRQRLRKLFRRSIHSNGDEHTYRPPPLVFLIATRQVNSLQEEMETFKDLLVFDTDEKYMGIGSSPPQKVYGFIDAVLKHVPSAQYIMKIDDDLHIDGLIFTQASITKYPSPFICGRVGSTRQRVIRNTEAKWHVRTEWYNESQYPVYPSGIFYTMDRQAAKMMMDTLRAHDNPHLLKLPEDALIGIFAEDASIRIHNIELYMNEVRPNGEIKDSCVFTRLKCKKDLIHEFMRKEGNPPWPKDKEAKLQHSIRSKCRHMKNQ